METKRDCNSNTPSGRSTGNPSSPQDEAPNEAQNPAPNAFTSEFLQKLHEREDAPLAALEAEMRGPWKVVEIPAVGADAPTFAVDRWAVVRAWEDPKVDPPAGTFRFREVALMYAAALAVASRGAVLSVRDARDDEEGGGSGGSTGAAAGTRRLVVVQWTPDGREQVVGHIPIWDEDVIAALRNVEALLRSSEALAQLLEAGCGPVAELLGRRLMAE
jgi:hypothetical protein